MRLLDSLRNSLNSSGDSQPGTTLSSRLGSYLHFKWNQATQPLCGTNRLPDIVETKRFGSNGEIIDTSEAFGRYANRSNEMQEDQFSLATGNTRYLQ